MEIWKDRVLERNVSNVSYSMPVLPPPVRMKLEGSLVVNTVDQMPFDLGELLGYTVVWNIST